MALIHQPNRTAGFVPGAAETGRTAAICCRALLLGAVLAMAVFSGTGCAGVDEDNVSERPWNAPRGWEHGLPPQLYERDR